MVRDYLYYRNLEIVNEESTSTNLKTEKWNVFDWNNMIKIKNLSVVASECSFGCLQPLFHLG